MSSDRYMLGADIRVTPAHDDGRVLLNVETGRLYAINGLGSAIISGLQDCLSPEQIIDRIATSYDTPRDQVAADIEAFLAALARLRLVETRTREGADSHSEVS